ncbi:MAG: nuclear transport factor 2 family protein [Bacteroidota bacterium]
MIETIHRFYTAFQTLDAEAMAACYHPEIEFQDPAFGLLKGVHAGNMWRMLCASQKGKDFRVEFSNVRMEGTTGRAHWEAFYQFGPKQRSVHNKIEAYFTFEGDKIILHRDDFDLHKWAKMAMGPMGALLGWTGYFRQKLHAQTNQRLKWFESKLEQSSLS